LCCTGRVRSGASGRSHVATCPVQIDIAIGRQWLLSRACHHLIGLADQVTGLTSPAHPISIQRGPKTILNDRTRLVSSDRTRPASSLCTTAVACLGTVPGESPVAPPIQSLVELDLLAMPRVTDQTHPVIPSDLLLFSNNIPCVNVLTPPSFITCACDLAFHKLVFQGMLALTRS
jgi:hypothetical protein